MSRINYGEPDSVADDLRMWAFEHNGYRALKGKKGQKLLRELEAALLALPGKRLIADDFMRDGEVCALAAYDLYKRAQASSIPAALAQMEAVYCHPDYDGIPAAEMTDHETLDVAQEYGWARPLAFMVLEENEADNVAWTPEERWQWVMRWVQSCIQPPTRAPQPGEEVDQ